MLVATLEVEGGGESLAPDAAGRRPREGRLQDIGLVRGVAGLLQGADDPLGHQVDDC